jgi:hypothetical protein
VSTTEPSVRQTEGVLLRRARKAEKHPRPPGEAAALPRAAWVSTSDAPLGITPSCVGDRFIVPFKRGGGQRGRRRPRTTDHHRRDGGGGGAHRHRRSRRVAPVMNPHPALSPALRRPTTSSSSSGQDAAEAPGRRGRSMWRPGTSLPTRLMGWAQLVSPDDGVSRARVCGGSSRAPACTEQQACMRNGFARAAADLTPSAGSCRRRPQARANQRGPPPSPAASWSGAHAGSGARRSRQPSDFRRGLLRSVRKAAAMGRLIRSPVGVEGRPHGV